MSNSRSNMLLGLTLLLTIIVIVKSRPDVPITQVQKNLPKAGHRPECEGNVALLGGNAMKQTTDGSKYNTDINLSAGMKELSKDLFDDRVLQREAFLHHFWNIQNITYKVLNSPTYLKKTDVDIEIARAFAAFSEVTNLTFTPKDAGEVDIRIEFLVKGHGNSFYFDGRGGIIAYAPTTEGVSFVYFDNNEYWTINSTKHFNTNEYKKNSSKVGLDLFENAVHEIGHVLGLAHSAIGNVMYTSYNSYNPNFKLGKLDIERIQYLYGSKSSPSINGPFVDFAVPRSNNTFLELLTNYPLDIDICNDPKIDAVFNSADNQIYIFKSNKYYKLSRYSAAGGYPKLISDGWPGLPGDIDAAFEYRDGKTYFFKGTKYWRYNGSQMDEGYPKEISEGFPGVPDDLDTAMVWDDGGKIYFFKGNKFWSFDPTKEPSVKSNYIRSYTKWKFLPMNLDAAFLDFDGLTYFFKDVNFHQIDPKKRAIKEPTKLAQYNIALANSCMDYLLEKFSQKKAGKVAVVGNITNIK